MQHTNKFIAFAILCTMLFSFMACNNKSRKVTEEDILNNLTEGAKLEVQSIQKQLPLDLGNDLTMTACQFIEVEKVFEYTVSVQEATAHVIKTDPDAFVNSAKPAMISSLTANRQTSTALQYDFIFKYIYTDSQGNDLCRITISQNDLE